jgi:hypothetical protein
MEAQLTGANGRLYKVGELHLAQAKLEEPLLGEKAKPFYKALEIMGTSQGKEKVLVRSSGFDVITTAGNDHIVKSLTIASGIIILTTLDLENKIKQVDIWENGSVTSSSSGILGNTTADPRDVTLEGDAARKKHDMLNRMSKSTLNEIEHHYPKLRTICATLRSKLK